MLYDNIEDLEYIKQVLKDNPTNSKILWVKNKIDITENQKPYDFDISGEKFQFRQKKKLGLKN